MSATAAPALLGWVLVHFVWQGALVGLLHTLAERGLALGSARRRHDTALAALGVAALLPVATALILLYTVGGADAAGSSRVASAIAVGSGAVVPAVVPAISPVLRAIDGRLAVLVTLWAAGVVVGGLRLAAGWWHLRRATAGPLAYDPLVTALAGSLGLRRVPEVIESARFTTPLVAGCRRPVLVLPLGLRERLAPAELRSLLLHELAHVARRDAALNLAQRVVETLLWFHPAVARVSAALRREREHCCDEAAVRAGERPLVLARALVRLEEWRTEMPALGLACTGGELTLRVHRLVTPATPRRASLLGVTAAAIPALAAAVAGPALVTDASTAPSLLPPRVTITAVDPAGPFVLELRGERARMLTLAGVPVPAERLVQHGRTLEVLDAGGRPHLSLRIKPGGFGIEWSPRPPPDR